MRPTARISHFRFQSGATMLVASVVVSFIDCGGRSVAGAPAILGGCSAKGTVPSAAWYSAARVAAHVLERPAGTLAPAVGRPHAHTPHEMMKAQVNGAGLGEKADPVLCDAGGGASGFRAPALPAGAARRRALRVRP